MRFDDSLRYNSVPEWTAHYLDYAGMKKTIYQLEKEKVALLQRTDDTEQTSLMYGSPHDVDPVNVFQNKLNAELKKVDTFYTNTEEKLYGELDKLIDDHQAFLEERENYNDSFQSGRRASGGSLFKPSYRKDLSDSDDEDDDYEPSASRSKNTPSNQNTVSRLGEVMSPPQSRTPSAYPSTTNFNGASSIRSQRTPSSAQLNAATASLSNNHIPVGSINSATHSLSGSAEGSRAQSPVRLYRHSRNHSVDASELRHRSNSDFGTASGVRGSRRSSSASPRKRSMSVVSFRAAAEPFSVVDDQFVTLRIRTSNIFVSLSNLKSFLDLNRTGFSKALKKFDKIMNTSLKTRYMEQVLSKAYCFSVGTEEHLKERIQEAVAIYADLVTNGDHAAATEQLHAFLRERVVFDRNTVWRDQMELSRQAHVTPVVKDVKLLGEDTQEKPVTYYHLGKLAIPSYIFSPQIIKLTITAIIFVILLSVKVLESGPQNRCLAVVVTASILWATEAMPLFVTSLLVPFLVITLRIPCNADGVPLEATAASQFIFSQMWSSVIMLLLGGFTLAAALSKYSIAKMLATFVLSRAGSNPRVVLLTLMFLATFLSMWISNVAAPVLCYSIAQPLLRTLPPNSIFGQAVVLGIALASNIGGMASPIASPQNIIALQNMDPPPTWGQWFAVSIPLSILSNLLIWVFLIVTCPPDKGVRVTAPIRMLNDKFGPKQWFISIVTVATIILWCLSHQLEPYVGEMGVLALIPIVLFFGTGLLSSDDFNNFLWTIIALAMGGIALGKAVSTSGLLATVAHGIETYIIAGMGTFGVMVVFGFIILIVATFVSHTVAALIILPLIQSIGARMDDPHPGLLVMGAAFLCSCAMGLPTSGFPNVTAICMVDELGRPYLTVGTFISRGVPSSFIAYILVVTLGYFIMYSIGF